MWEVENVMVEKTVFHSTVRLQKGLLETGRISSLKLLPLVGEYVEVVVRPVVVKPSA